MEKLTYSEFKEKYKPIQNHLVDDAAFSGTMFETYDEELKFVQKANYFNIWTILEGDDGTYISNGAHIVNRMGYIITEEPWNKEEDIIIECEKEESFQAIAVIDLSNSSLHIYDLPITDNDEDIEYVLEKTFGHHLSNCSWGQINELIDHR